LTCSSATKKERFDAICRQTVCHPFYKLSHEWPAKYYVIPIFCFSFLYNIPKFFELKTHYAGKNSTEVPTERLFLRRRRCVVVS
jgi:hypothetical protein